MKLKYDIHLQIINLLASLFILIWNVSIKLADYLWDHILYKYFSYSFGIKTFYKYVYAYSYYIKLTDKKTFNLLKILSWNKKINVEMSVHLYIYVYIIVMLFSV